MLQKRREKVVKVRRVKDFTRKSTESTDLGSQGLTETDPTTREPASTNLRTVHI